MNTIRDKKGRIKKGQCLSPETQFKKGQLGWWKGKQRPYWRGENNCNWKGGEIKKSCEFCKKEFSFGRYRKHTARFCSHPCRLKSRHWVKTGKDSNWWKGGKSRPWDLLKETDKYKEWRRKVYERDWFRCRWCDYRSKKKGDIQAHHIVPMRDDKRLWFKVSNGITLCIKCHRKTYGKEKKFAMVFKEILNDYTPGKEKS